MHSISKHLGSKQTGLHYGTGLRRGTRFFSLRELAFLNSCAVFSLSATMRTLSTATQCIEKQHIYEEGKRCVQLLSIHPRLVHSLNGQPRSLQRECGSRRSIVPARLLRSEQAQVGYASFCSGSRRSYTRVKIIFLRYPL